MSQAFVRESDDSGLLQQVEPTLHALVRYLQREQGESVIYLEQWKKTDGVNCAVMSNGFSYFLNPDKQWEIIL